MWTTCPRCLRGGRVGFEPWLADLWGLNTPRLAVALSLPCHDSHTVCGASMGPLMRPAPARPPPAHRCTEPLANTQRDQQSIQQRAKLSSAVPPPLNSSDLTHKCTPAGSCPPCTRCEPCPPGAKALAEPSSRHLAFLMLPLTPGTPTCATVAAAPPPSATRTFLRPEPRTCPQAISS